MKYSLTLIIKFLLGITKLDSNEKKNEYAIDTPSDGVRFSA